MQNSRRFGDVVRAGAPIPAAGLAVGMHHAAFSPVLVLFSCPMRIVMRENPILD
jgi:hypothetical protein